MGGVRPNLTHTNSLAKLPTYGLEVQKEKELDEVAKGVDWWGMDMFLVRELSNGHPLLTIFYTILKVRTPYTRLIAKDKQMWCESRYKFQKFLMPASSGAWNKRQNELVT